MNRAWLAWFTTVLVVSLLFATVFVVDFAISRRTTSLVAAGLALLGGAIGLDTITTYRRKRRR